MSNLGYLILAIEVIGALGTFIAVSRWCWDLPTEPNYGDLFLMFLGSVLWVPVWIIFGHYYVLLYFWRLCRVGR